MFKRTAQKVFAIVALIGGFDAQACKQLRFPEHLTETKDFGRDHYLLVQIDETEASTSHIGTSAIASNASGAAGPVQDVGSSFEATILESYGDVDRSGQRVRIEFFTNEQAHAVCPLRIDARQRFLLRSKDLGDVLTLSRYDLMNISADHEKFEVYVADLRSLREDARRRNKTDRR